MLMHPPRACCMFNLRPVIPTQHTLPTPRSHLLCRPGPDGLEHFLATLQAIGIKVASASQVTFLCRSPDTGEEMALKGLTAFDAAAYCASITAAKRMQRDSSRRPSSDCGVTPEGASDSPTARHDCSAAALTVQPSAGSSSSGNSNAGSEGASASALSAPQHAHAAQAAPLQAVAASGAPWPHARLAPPPTPHHHSSWLQRMVACIPMLSRHHA